MVGKYCWATVGAIYSLQYDVVRDFEPVMLLPDAPMLLIAKKATPANDLSEFIASRANLTPRP